MTDETEANDFAAFEAMATATETVEAPAPEAEAVTPADEPEVEATEEATEEAEETKAEDDEPKKRRSKPASERIAELTARLRETERQLEATRSPEAKAEVVKPDPADFEFGEADPDYLDKLTDYKIEMRDAEKSKETEEQQQKQKQFETLELGIVKAEQTAKAKYDDFDARISEAVEARGGEPLPRLLTIGISVSPVGGDLIYRLATDDAVSDKLEALAEKPQAFALELGALEAEYLDDETDSDLDVTDQLDMARMLGRMRARLNGNRPSAPAPTIRLTNAPEPPKERARGGSGQMGTPADTTDFAAFERLASKR